MAIGSCAAGFFVDGTFHSLSCGPVRPELISDEVVARGDGLEVRRINDVDPAVMVAISIKGGECADGDTALSPWSMAFPGDGTEPELHDAICNVTFQEHHARNNCG